MNYTTLLNQLIDASGLQLKEIADKCNLMGENISPSYISVLKNTVGRTASDNVSLAIAKACGAKHDDILVVQAYLDCAPKPIIDALNKIRELAVMSTVQLFKENVTDEVFSLLHSEIDKMPLAEFVCESNKLNIDNPLINKSTRSISLDGINSKTIIDDSMEPLMAKNSKIKYELSKEIHNGDIVLYKNKLNDENKFRQCMILENDKCAFIPLNRKYASEILNKDDFILIGKVKEITNLLY